LFNQLNAASIKISGIIESIENGSDEIMTTFDSDLVLLKKLLKEINQNILPISEIYSDLVLSTPVKNLAFNIPTPMDFQSKRAMFESASRTESPAEMLRRASKAVTTSLSGLTVFKS
jgi:hypothetical protein